MGWGEKGAAVVLGITQPHLNPNFVTQYKRNRTTQTSSAEESIEPVRITVKIGQIVVRKGDVVTEEQLQMMGELGAASRPSRAPGTDMGTGSVCAIDDGMLLAYFYKFVPRTFSLMTASCCWLAWLSCLPWLSVGSDIFILILLHNWRSVRC